MSEGTNESYAIRVGTHGGPFHADDVFAVALFYVLFPNRKTTVIRTSESNVLRTCHYRVDVGRKYDPTQGDFDHHQGGVGARENGVSYAAAGLVWKYFGNSFQKSAFERIDRIIQTIDAHDNRQAIFTQINSDLDIPAPCTLPHLVQAFCPDWTEEPDFDGQFNKVLQIVIEYLKRELLRAQAAEKLEEVFKRAVFHENGRVMELPCYCPWKDKVKKGCPIVQFVISPARGMAGWMIECVYGQGNEYRKLLPEAWAGKEDGALQQITGVQYAVFCHQQRFCARALTKEDALKLAELALQ